ncbi:MAG: hypothetical protein U0414_14480 [Polyangiaceae bacterium]
MGSAGRAPLFAPLAAMIVAWSACGAKARADDTALVVVLEPAPPRTASVDETFTRLEAELRAGGFEVRTEILSSLEPRDALEDAIRRTHAIAAITVQSGEGPEHPEVWVRDRLTGKLVVRVDDTPSGSPQLVAIHGVELLRASLIELRDPPPSSASDAAPLPKPIDDLIGPRAGEGPDRAPSSAWRGFGVELGVGTIVHFDPAQPMVAPALRLSLGSSIGLGGRLVLVGPSIGPDVRGEASVSEVLLSAEGFFAPALPWPFEFIGAAGIGLYRVGAESTIRPDPAPSGGEAAMLFTFGAGTGVRLTEHFALDLNLLVGVSARRVVLLRGAEELGALGQPLFGATAGVRAAF